MKVHRHYHYITSLRAMAIVAVVAIHGLANIVNNTSQISWDWQLAMLINLSLRWAVPVFFMISGALLLSKDKVDNTIFLKKRLERLAVPAVVFIVAYFFWYNHPTFSISLTEYVYKVFVWGNPYYHLYFLYAIAGLYLLTPALRVMVRQASDRTLVATIGVILAMTSYWSLSTSWFVGKFPRDTLMAATHFLPYIGYFLLGYYLHARYKSNYRQMWLWLGIVGVWLAYMLSVQLFADSGYSARSLLLEGYGAPNVILSSLAIFMGVKLWHDERQVKQLPSWVESLAASALGIYLLHVMILEWSARVLNEQNIGGWWLVGVVTMVALVGSWFIAWVLGKLPGLRWVVGR